MIPKTYDEWLKCIQEDCNITLTPEFVQERLNTLSNQNNEETKKFRSIYGKEHLSNIIKWYNQYKAI